jgi:FemAB-related protein (PEP-CTERM system-associated)
MTDAGLAGQPEKKREAAKDSRPVASGADRAWGGIVEKIAAGGQAEWDAYVDAHPRGSLYHRYAWRTAAERAYRLRTPFLVARERAGGAIAGLLPLFVVDGIVGRRYVTTCLFGGYGAILADSEGAHRALLDEACRVTRDARAQYLQIKALHEAACPSGFASFELGAVATLSLEGGPDALWKRFRDKARNAVRKAQKSGLELRVGPRELPHFYDVLAGNYHRKGTPIYGYRIMETLARELRDNAEAVTLWKDGSVVSGALVVYDKDTVYVPFCSSRADAFRLNPNNLIYWEIMRRACDRGMKTLDFGRSPLGSGSLAFKLHWGAVTTPQPYFVHAARGEPPALDVEAPSVQRLIKLWQRLPRPVADALGPWVHGHFLV